MPEYVGAFRLEADMTWTPEKVSGDLATILSLNDRHHVETLVKVTAC